MDVGIFLGINIVPVLVRVASECIERLTECIQNIPSLLAILLFEGLGLLVVLAVQLRL